MAAKKAQAQIGAQLYSLRDYMKTPKDMAKTLKRIRKIGYQLVQISGIGPIDPLDLRKIMDDADVTAVGHHTNMGQLRNDINGLIDMLHVWGVQYTAVAFLADNERKTLGDWKKRAKEMTKFGKVLKKEGITLQYHNHDFEFIQFGRKYHKGGKTGLQILYENSDPKYLQSEIDTCWIARGGGDPADWILRMKGRADQIHLKDTVRGPEGMMFAPVGEGNLNWPAILAACKKAKVKHYLVEQDNCPLTKNPFKSMEISYNNLRKHGLK